MSTHIGSGKPIRLNMAFSCFATDVLMTYAFARSYDLLEDPSFETNLHVPIMTGPAVGRYVKYFPFVGPLMRSLPEYEDQDSRWMPTLLTFFSSFVTVLSPDMAMFFQFQRVGTIFASRT